MDWAGFESTIPAVQRAKTVHALDHAATVIGLREVTEDENGDLLQIPTMLCSPLDAKQLLLATECSSD
jgi:hypothetical protein